MNKISHNVCALITSKDDPFNKGKILTVSRKNNPFNYGLVGGKVEKNETDLEAIKRECLEEIGTIPNDLILIFANTCSDNSITITYHGTVNKDVDLQTQENLIIKWSFFNEICEDTYYNEEPLFAAYNKKLFKTTVDLGIPLFYQPTIPHYNEIIKELYNYYLKDNNDNEILKRLGIVNINDYYF